MPDACTFLSCSFPAGECIQRAYGVLPEILRDTKCGLYGAPSSPPVEPEASSVDTGLPGGDSVTLIETIRAALNMARLEQTPGTGKHEMLLDASEALAVLELRESDRQSSESRGLETASAVSVEEIHRLREANTALMRINGGLRGRESGQDDHWCSVEGCKQAPTFYAFESDEFVCDAHIYYGADNPWLSEYVPRDLIVSAIADLSHPKPSVDSALVLLREAIDLTSATAALPPPESGSSGLGSASALEVEGRELGALRRQLLDAMSAWSEDNYAAGWLSGLDRMLCQRRGIWEIIASVTGWPLGYEADCGWVTWGEARTHYGLPASAAKPEASPSPESEQEVEIGAAIRPRAEAGDLSVWDECGNEIRVGSRAIYGVDSPCIVTSIEEDIDDSGDGSAVIVAVVSIAFEPDTTTLTARGMRQSGSDEPRFEVSDLIASTTTAEPSPSPERKTICTWPFCECDPNIPLMCGLPAPSSRPVSTDEEEGE